MTDCVFCTMATSPEKVPHRIAESERALAFLDIRPIRKGHALVIPKTHAVDLSDVSREDLHAVMDLVQEVRRVLRTKLGSTGENLLVASGPGSEQAVFHLHIHVIPRLEYDDLQWNHWWQTKVHFPGQAALNALATQLRS